MTLKDDVSLDAARKGAALLREGALPDRVEGVTVAQDNQYGHIVTVPPSAGAWRREVAPRRFGGHD
jgi:hypothetical protein